METQVISVGPEGQMSGLQVKPGRGVDLTWFGQAQVVRASEVLWSEDRQAWYVEIREGRYAGKVLSHPMLSLATGTRVEFSAEHPTVFFSSYEAAVAAEIAFLDHIRVTEGPSVLQPVAISDASAGPK